MFLPIISFVSLVLLAFFTSSCQAGSMTSWHKLTNGTEEEIFVTFFEGYPVNRSYSKLIKPNEVFEIKDEVNRPGYYCVISVTKNVKQEREIVLRKMYSWHELFLASQEDKVDGFHITEERLAAWDRDPK